MMIMLCVGHQAQGNLKAFNYGVRHIIDSQDFIQDSLFCEWGYVINLDDRTVEVYTGFQKHPDKKSRYQIEKPDGERITIVDCHI